MGTKGDKSTAGGNLAAEEFAEKIGSIDGITTKKMFGGHGVFHDGKMFGIVDSKSQVYLKAAGDTINEFESHGSKKHGKMPYYSIPAKVMENHNLLLDWVRKAIDDSK